MDFVSHLFVCASAALLAEQIVAKVDDLII
jgi:hypothetical protein